MTVTLDSDLIAAGNAAVAVGKADSVTSWVNDAVRLHTERERRLQALALAIADYEAEFGVITAQEMAAARVHELHEDPNGGGEFLEQPRGTSGRPDARRRRAPLEEDDSALNVDRL
jgi:hypothetical protein